MALHHCAANRSLNKRLLTAIIGAASVAAAILLGLANPSRIHAQSAQMSAPDWQTAAGGKMAFDVASVKPNKLHGQANSNVPLGPGEMYSPNGGLFSAKDNPLLVYIMFAFKVTSLNDLQGIPSWVADDNFDIEARSQTNPTKDQMRLMVQSLLADRFKLVMHTENKTKPIYELVLSKPGKTGPQLQRYTDDGSCAATTTFAAPPPSSAPSPPTSAFRLQLPPSSCGDFLVLPASAPSRFRVGGKNVPMSLIARQLPTAGLAGVNRPVFDRTGLSGTFSFSIEWTPRLPGTTPPSDETDPTFTAALNEQLGLRLESTKGPVDVLVIDHIEEPSEN
jgi:uncharacterized protein (TIGR03435 family)